MNLKVTLSALYYSVYVPSSQKYPISHIVTARVYYAAAASAADTDTTLFSVFVTLHEITICTVILMPSNLICSLNVRL